MTTEQCWHNRFHPTLPACPQPATWQGPSLPRTIGEAMTRAWRACDAHRLPFDVPIRDHNLPSSTDGLGHPFPPDPRD